MPFYDWAGILGVPKVVMPRTPASWFSGLMEDDEPDPAPIAQKRTPISTLGAPGQKPTVMSDEPVDPRRVPLGGAALSPPASREKQAAAQRTIARIERGEPEPVSPQSKERVEAQQRRVRMGLLARERRASAGAAKTARDQMYEEQRKRVMDQQASGGYYFPADKSLYGPNYVTYVNEWQAKALGIKPGAQAAEYTIAQDSDSLLMGKAGQERAKLSGFGSARGNIDRMSPEKLAEFRYKAVQSGLAAPNQVFGPVPGPADYEMMKNLMSVTNVTAFTNYDQTLDAYYETAMRGGGPGGAGSGSGSRGSGPSAAPTKITNRVYQKTSLDQGRTTIRQLMTDMMGRAPNEDEVRRYVAALNRKEAQNPDVTTTVYGSGGAVVTSRTLENAPDPGEVLRGEIAGASDEEIAEYEAVGFMGILDSMLGTGGTSLGAGGQ